MDTDSVRDGYDLIADTYAAQRDQFKSTSYLNKFIEFLPPGGTVLDVGCGAGKPVDAFLIEQGYAVHGLDISTRMIELARRNVPQAHFETRDMSDLAMGEYRVDGVVAFYSIFHTPREQHQLLLQRLASFMSPGGALLITMGAGAWEGFDDDFHGARMYWSHFGKDRNIELVEHAGFRVLLDEIDRSGDEAHQIIIARREATAASTPDALSFTLS
jgi:SAM-dependent methyltransferase